MAANAEIVTDEEIASIAERMSHEGRAVSPVSVWSELRRGSIVDIAAALQRWRDARQPEAPSVSVNAALPQELGESVLSVAQRLWVVAREETDKAHSQRASVISQRLNAALGDRDEALAEFQRVDAQAAADRRQLTDLQGELRVATDATARLREDLAAATDRAERSQAMVGEIMQHASVEEDKLKAATASLEEERRAHEALRAELSFKDDETARARQEHERAQGEIARLTQELQARTDETGRLVQEHQARVDEAARLTQELQARSDEAARQEQERSAATSRAEAASAQAEQQAARIAQLQGELDDARNAIEAERSASAARAGEMQAQVDEHQRMTRELEQARAQIELSNDEKAAANEELAWLKQDASTARSEASTARDRATQLESQLSELGRNDAASQAEQSRLAQELAETRERLAGLEHQLAERAQGESASHAEQARLAQELSEARERAAQLETQFERQQAEVARLTEEANAAREEAARLQQQLAQRDRDEATAKEARRGQDQALQSRVAANEQEVVNLQRQIANQAKTHTKAYDELRTNAEQWVTYAKDLKQRLDIANEKMVFIDARSTGEVALLRRLSSELERLKPDHELVFREAQQKLIGDKMSQQLAQKGYRYDPSTAVMSKIDG